MVHLTHGIPSYHVLMSCPHCMPISHPAMHAPSNSRCKRYPMPIMQVLPITHQTQSSSVRCASVRCVASVSVARLTIDPMHANRYRHQLHSACMLVTVLYSPIASTRIASTHIEPMDATRNHTQPYLPIALALSALMQNSLCNAIQYPYISKKIIRMLIRGFPALTCTNAISGTVSANVVYK